MRGRNSAKKGRNPAVRGRKSANHPQVFPGEEFSHYSEPLIAAGEEFSPDLPPEKGS